MSMITNNGKDMCGIYTYITKNKQNCGFEYCKQYMVPHREQSSRRGANRNYVVCDDSFSSIKKHKNDRDHERDTKDEHGEELNIDSEPDDDHMNSLFEYEMSFYEDGMVLDESENALGFVYKNDSCF